MITRFRRTQAAVYTEVIVFSLSYVAVIAGFSHQIALAAGIV